MRVLSFVLFSLSVLTVAVLTVSAQTPFQEPARKAKLGEIHYSARIGGTVGEEDKKFSVMAVNENDRLVSIAVCLATNGSDLVRAIRLEVADKQGKTRIFTCGDSVGGKWLTPHKVPSKSQLVGISGSCGWFVDSIRFHFDDGSETPLYGSRSGGDTDYRLVLSRKNGQLKGRFVGFWGTATEYLETIGLVFFPIE
jgi:hypothetical protein